jgi:hypothetical protein
MISLFCAGLLTGLGVGTILTMLIFGTINAVIFVAAAVFISAGIVLAIFAPDPIKIE